MPLTLAMIDFGSVLQRESLHKRRIIIWFLKMLQHFRRNVFIQGVIGSNFGHDDSSGCGHDLRVGTESVKKWGSSSTRSPWLTGVFASAPPPAKQG